MNWLKTAFIKIVKYNSEQLSRHSKEKGGSLSEV
jgi:hypothetical protein